MDRGHRYNLTWHDGAYGYRPIVREIDGSRQVEWFDFSALKHIYLNVRVDVGTTNIWSDQARKMALDNLFTSGAIDIIQYLERLDDQDIPDRQGLIDDIKQTMTDKQFIQGMMEQYVQALPMDAQASLHSSNK